MLKAEGSILEISHFLPLIYISIYIYSHIYICECDTDFDAGRQDFSPGSGLLPHLFKLNLKAHSPVV